MTDNQMALLAAPTPARGCGCGPDCRCQGQCSCATGKTCGAGCTCGR